MQIIGGELHFNKFYVYYLKNVYSYIYEEIANKIYFDDNQ